MADIEVDEATYFGPWTFWHLQHSLNGEGGRKIVEEELASTAVYGISSYGLDINAIAVEDCPGVL